MKTLKNIFAAIAVASIGGLAGAGIYNLFDKDSVVPIPERQAVKYVSYPGSVQPAVDFTIAAEKTVPAVVHVKSYVENQYNNNLLWDPFRDFFYDRYRQQQPQVSAGSGVIITDDGYIVTNNHVIQNASKLEVVMDDKKTYPAKLIGSDASTDLALLKIDDKNLPFIPYGNSDEVKVGQWALAVGNPYNLTSTVTAGIISAKARNINILPDQYSIESFLQTDAAVNPGNSGGALVNTDGSLIGINSAIASNTGSYSGYSFAIPVNLVRKVVDDLLEYGTVQRGFIGVNIKDIDSKLADEKGLTTFKGVYVSGLTEGGAAEAAGIQEGDVIQKIAGYEVNTSSHLIEQVGRHRPGDKIEVLVLRDGKERIINVTLKDRSGNTKLVKNDLMNVLGAELQPVGNDDKKRLGIEYGVKISKLYSGKFRSVGIKEGFIITAIDKKRVTSPDDVVMALKSKGENEGVLVQGIYPNGMTGYYAIGM